MEMLESVFIVFGIYNFEADMQRCCYIATAMMDRQGTRVKFCGVLSMEK